MNKSLVWEGDDTIHVAFHHMLSHRVFSEKSQIGMSKLLEYCVREKQDAPSPWCTWQEKRVPQRCWGVRGEARLNWGVAVDRYQFYPHWGTEEVKYFSVGTESSLLYQACTSPVVCESKPSLAYQLRTNHFLSQTRGKIKEQCGNY